MEDLGCALAGPPTLPSTSLLSPPLTLFLSARVPGSLLSSPAALSSSPFPFSPPPCPICLCPPLFSGDLLPSFFPLLPTLHVSTSPPAPTPLPGCV